MNKPPIGLTFGSAGIDQLIDPAKLRYDIGSNKPIVACIAGPDGAGKSILALTAASICAATKPYKDRRVIYASTDLNIDQAKKTWEHFGLDSPSKRRWTLRRNIEQLYFSKDDIEKLRENDKNLESHCDLRWLSPFPSSNPNRSPPSEKDNETDNDDKNKPVKLETLETLFDPNPKPLVNFLDLAAFSAGDDWGLINHIVGLLRCEETDEDISVGGDDTSAGGQTQEHQAGPHLLVVDAVEGLEAMAGRRDRFGLKRTRRSRLAQLVRLTRQANCSVIFIIEQKSPDVHLDEVFVSDLVLRLRTQQNDEYLQKTIEVEKARSVSHIRGIHELQIRDGSGSFDGTIIPDDCQMLLEQENNQDREIGYMQVIPSLHQKHRPASTTRNVERENTSA